MYDAWVILPFFFLLFSIALGPILLQKYWHANYIEITLGLAAIVVFEYSIQNKLFDIIHAFAEYIQFISVIGALFVATSGISILNPPQGTPLNNVKVLALSAILSNLIGTTGASMLLISPYIKMNQGRIRPYHIVFFIFVVSNVGGVLTPIGDPPLFIGFLKGVPFFWTLKKCIIPWGFAVAVLLLVFYCIDRKNERITLKSDAKIKILGKKNFLWLVIIVSTVFLDPHIFKALPTIKFHGHSFSFIREILLILYSIVIHKKADIEALKENNFSFEPLREISIIFIGIFITMVPVIELVGNFAKSEVGQNLVSPNFLYWGTGFLSSFLDNAPTYLNFLAVGMGSKGLTIDALSDVNYFANGLETSYELRAISLAAVFFGAMTYIGNGPNMMVKSIAEHQGIKMPSFFAYIFRYSLLILMPIISLVWIIFIF